MSRNTKIVLGVIAGILGVCCIIAIVAAFVLQRVGRNIAEGVTDNPVEAAAVADNIVDYALPAGFQEEGSMSVLGMSFVIISSNDNDAAIMLMSFPSVLAGNEEEMQRQMEDTMSGQFGQENIDLSYVGAEDVVINGEGTLLNIFEGTDENGVQIRQATAVFEGKNGNPSMLMVFTPIDRWESANIDTFIDSLE